MTNQKNNCESFVRLLVGEDSAVKALARGLFPSWHDVEVIVQQASLIAWNESDELGDRDRFGGWRLTIARYGAMKHRRSLGCSPLVFFDELPEPLAEAQGERSAVDADRRRAFEGCLLQLDAARRERIQKVHRPSAY